MTTVCDRCGHAPTVATLRPQESAVVEIFERRGVVHGARRAGDGRFLEVRSLRHWDAPATEHGIIKDWWDEPLDRLAAWWRISVKGGR